MQSETGSKEEGVEGKRSWPALGHQHSASSDSAASELEPGLGRMLPSELQSVEDRDSCWRGSPVAPGPEIGPERSVVVVGSVGFVGE